mgnify:CR=1 FL=1
MGDSILNISKYQTVWKSINLQKGHAISNAGTFNSVAYVANTQSSLYDRFTFATEIDANKTVTQYPFTLPNDYKDGTDVKVRFITTSLATTGNIRHDVGLSKLNASDVYDAETSTEYIASTVAANSDGTLFKVLDGGLLTFNGSTLVAGEPICIIIARDPAHASDTVSATTYVGDVIIYYQSESYQPETLTQKLMSLFHKTVYKSMTFRGTGLLGNSGTFNSLVCGAGGTIILNGMWQSGTYADAAKTAQTRGITLPVDFVAGKDLIIEIDGYSSGAGSGTNIKIGVGISRASIGSVYPTDSATTYLTDVITLGAAFDKATKTFAFSTTGFVAGDVLGIVVYREGDHASDSATVNFRVTQFTVKYPSNKHGIQTVV